MALIDKMLAICGPHFEIICELIRKDGRVFTNTPSRITTLNCMFGFPQHIFDTCWQYSNEIGRFTNAELLEVVRDPKTAVRTRKLPSIFKFPKSA